MLKKEPLTEEQSRRAARYFPLARKLAKRLKLSVPSLAAEWESVACLALVEASGSYDPARGLKFATYAMYKIDFALLDALRREARLKGFRDEPPPDGDGAGEADPPVVMSLSHASESYGTVLRSTPDTPIDEAVADAELLDVFLAKLPPRLARIVRLTELDGLTNAEAAPHVGLKAGSGVSVLRLEARERLRAMAQRSLSA